MGKIYDGLKRIKEKIDYSGDYEPYQQLIGEFINLATYENAYLQKKLVIQDQKICFVLRNNGKDMFIDCMNFGIIIDVNDNISIHT